MPFQRSAKSWRSRAAAAGVKTPVLVGVCVAAALVLIVAARLAWGALAPSGVEVVPAADRASLAAEGGGTPEAAASGVYVHVSGAVASPGVYEVPEGARVRDAVEAAGGFAEGAASDALNLARAVVDGEQIVVPTQDEVSAAAAAAGAAGAGGSAPAGSGTSFDGKVNINRAAADELDALPGIGPSTAAKIVAGREANGPFQTVEDLKRVSGIGDKKYEALADQISVG